MRNLIPLLFAIVSVSAKLIAPRELRENGDENTDLFDRRGGFFRDTKPEPEATKVSGYSFAKSPPLPPPAPRPEPNTIRNSLLRESRPGIPEANAPRGSWNGERYVFEEDPDAATQASSLGIARLSFQSDIHELRKSAHRFESSGSYKPRRSPVAYSPDSYYYHGKGKGKKGGKKGYYSGYNGYNGYGKGGKGKGDVFIPVPTAVPAQPTCGGGCGTAPTPCGGGTGGCSSCTEGCGVATTPCSGTGGCTSCGSCSPATCNCPPGYVLETVSLQFAVPFPNASVSVAPNLPLDTVGTQFIYTSSIFDLNVTELPNTFFSGYCMRFQSTQVLTVNTSVVGNGYCHFSLTVSDGETNDAVTFNAAGEVFDVFGGTLAITGGTGDLQGAFGQLEIVPVYQDPNTQFDFFTQAAIYAANATILVPIRPLDTA